jgi:3-oxoacyl-[acyl-carrier protein] reductase
MTLPQAQGDRAGVQVALVTGASRGIGRAIALRLAADGFKVVGTATTEAGAAGIAAALAPHGGEGIVLNVTDGAALDAAIDGIVKRHGGLHVLVNNAGITRDGLLFRMSEADWNDVISTNLSSCFHWTKHLARPMTRARWGRIVNITSVSGIMGNAGQANYSAAKAGMIGLTKTLAREFAGRSVTVNAVAPGFIKTDMTTDFVNNPEVSAKILEAVPLKRFGEAADIAAATVFLCSEEAGYVTGQVFAVDGGMAM